MTLQLPSNQLVTVPFCGLGTPTTDFVLPPITGSDSSLVQTQQFGIPPVQAQNTDFGGKPVLRTETNGVLQFYSNVLYFINQGGQFTFDSAQSTALGGYSQGAVLFNFPTSSYVISLMDNNTFNFVTTPSYIDGIHWIQLNSLAYPDITDSAGLVSITGANGLKVLKGASFLNDGTSAIFTITRASTTAPGGQMIFYPESPLTIPGITHGALIGLQGGSNVPFLGAGYTGAGNRFFQVNAAPRDMDPTIYKTALAMLGDIPVTNIFTVVDSGGNSWQLVCTSTGGNFPVPAGIGVTIKGSSNYSYPSGNANRTLSVAGISSGISVNTEAVANSAQVSSGTPLSAILINTVSSNINIFTNSSAANNDRLNFDITLF